MSGAANTSGRASERRPSAGYSYDTVIVDESYVLRRAPTGDATFATHDLALQTAVINSLVGVVPVPAPATFDGESMRMPYVDGVIPNDFTPIDPWLQSLPSDDARRTVWTSTIDAIAAIHRAPFAGLAGLRVGLDAEIPFWSSYVEWIDDAPPPALVDAMRWCAAHRPSTTPQDVLLWGDVRFGNVIYDPSTYVPRAILDWDMVSAGPPEMDIAWLTALTDVGFDLTKMTVPGFGTHADTVARFEAHLGRPLVDFDWYEIFALVRASAVSTRIAVLNQRAGKKCMFRIGDDPTLAYAQRKISAFR